MKQIILTLLVLSSAKALTHEQLKVRSLVMKIAKQRLPMYRKVYKGLNLRESSYGLHNFGDDGESLYSPQVSAIAFEDVIVNGCEFKKYKRVCLIKNKEERHRRLKSIILSEGQEFAITIGVEYLKLLIKRWGSIDLALDHYNGDLSGEYRKQVYKDMKEF